MNFETWNFSSWIFLNFFRNTRTRVSKLVLRRG